MKKRLCLFLLALSQLLTACAPASRPEPDPAPEETPAEVSPAPEGPEEPELSQREKDWVEDIEFLREEIKTKHADPFYFCPEEEFDWKLDRLIAKVGELSDNDIAYELAAIIAGLGDNHTSVVLPYERRFPISAMYFDKKLYVIACHGDYEQLEPYLLHEIVAVNGVDIEYICQKAISLGNPFNTWDGRENIRFSPDFLDWAGCGYREGYTFQILNDNREAEPVEIPVITAGEWREGPWTYHEKENLFYQKGGAWTAYLEGEKGSCVYVSLAEKYSASSVRLVMEETAKLLEEHPDCGKLAFDLRMHSGGKPQTMEPLREAAQMLEGKQIYVLTGGYTTSAAIVLLNYIRSAFGATITGEPTGQFPVMFHQSGAAHARPSVLPHSKLSVAVADLGIDNITEIYSSELFSGSYLAPAFEEYYNKDGRLYEWESAILPDVYVYQDVEDVRQGKDSVLEWVLAQ